MIESDLSERIDRGKSESGKLVNGSSTVICAAVVSSTAKTVCIVVERVVWIELIQIWHYDLRNIQAFFVPKESLLAKITTSEIISVGVGVELSIISARSLVSNRNIIAGGSTGRTISYSIVTANTNGADHTTSTVGSSLDDSTRTVIEMTVSTKAVNHAWIAVSDAIVANWSNALVSALASAFIVTSTAARTEVIFSLSRALHQALVFEGVAICGANWQVDVIAQTRIICP